MELVTEKKFPSRTQHGNMRDPLISPVLAQLGIHALPFLIDSQVCNCLSFS